MEKYRKIRRAHVDKLKPEFKVSKVNLWISFKTNLYEKYQGIRQYIWTDDIMVAIPLTRLNKILSKTRLAKINKIAKKYYQKEFKEGMQGIRLMPSKNYSGYVYVIRIDEFYKIGISKNIKNRIRNIESSSPRQTELIFSKKFDNYLKIEETLHERFKNKQVKNEWFKLTEDDLTYIRNL